MSHTWLRPLLKTAWPGADIDELLRIALADDGSARAAWSNFERRADLDRLAPGENRLIGLVAKRLPSIAPNAAMRARIAGIERANWTRTQITVGETAPALRALAAGGIGMLIIKGASRVATGDRLGRGRTLNDIDVVVRPADMERAFDLLVAAGWQPTSAGTNAFQRKYLTTGTGLNLVRGRFGNLDLHQSAFHAAHASPVDDPGVWQRARPGELAGVTVLLPAPTDALAIAIAHGALDAHRSSDWIADAAIAIDVGIDWTLFADIAARRRLTTGAAISLLYARERLQRPVPGELLDRLEHAAALHPLASLTTVIECRPKANRPGLAWLVRGAAKRLRLRRHPDNHAPRPVRAMLSLAPVHSGIGGGSAPALAQPLPIAERATAAPWQGTVDLTLAVAPQPAFRRLDFEVHVGGDPRLRLRARPYRSGARTFRFRFPLALAAGEPAPVIVAAPSRHFNAGVPPEVAERYAAVPFAVARLSAIPAPARSASGSSR